MSEHLKFKLSLTFPWEPPNLIRTRTGEILIFYYFICIKLSNINTSINILWVLWRRVHARVNICVCMFTLISIVVIHIWFYICLDSLHPDSRRSLYEQRFIFVHEQIQLPCLMLSRTYLVYVRVPASLALNTLKFYSNIRVGNRLVWITK